MKKIGFFVLGIFLSLAAVAQSTDRGLLLRSGDGAPFPAPARGTAIEMRVTGIVARARVTQIFSNPTPGWVEGLYAFPLPEGAAVDTLRMKVGDRVLDGVVREKKQAAAEYEQAKQEGRRASLLEFLSPGVFTTAVANIGPGETVEITIEMQQVVEYGHGRFGLRFPFALPRSAQIETPKTTPSFAFHLDLAPGFPLGRIESSSHQIAVARDDRKLRYAVDLAAGVAPADADFVLDWAPAVGREPRAVYFTEEVNGERYALLMVMPPDAPGAAASRLPRETVFVIDTSGSMSGDSIVQAKEALLLGLDRLAPTDAFEVIRFSDQAEALFGRSAPAGPGTLGQAKGWIGGFEADGGTNMIDALKIALVDQRAGGLLRQVIFITDGQVPNEGELLRFIGENLGASRLFTVAIGSAPNAAFLRKAAALGRGTFTAIAQTDRVAAGMTDLFSRIEAPLLRDVVVRWADPAAEAWPERIPDLYLGEPIVATARLRGKAGPVEVEGLRGDEPWQDEIPAAAEVRGAGLDKLWAGRKIQALLDSLAAGADDDEVQDEVTSLGLRHHLLTPYTSFVVAEIEPAFDPQEELGTEDAIMVTAESPLLDERRISTSATVTSYEMQSAAGQRDVWAVLQSTPGVLADRINTGGEESGRRPTAAAGGISATPVTWRIDGLSITDTAALGTSPGYYDFDSFEEAQVTTGGSDVSLETAGPQLVLIAPRGTNEWRAAGRLAWTGGALTADSSGDGEEGLDGLRLGSGDLGGPLRKDRLWIWGGSARSEVERTALGGGAEEVVRSNAGTRLNAQVTGSNSATVVARRGEASGTGAGAAPHRAPETTWDQDGRETLWAVETTQIFSSNFYLTLGVRGNEGSLHSLPGAGSGEDGRIDAAGVARGSWFTVDETQTAREAQVDTAYFANTGNVSHEIRLGGQTRSEDAERLVAPPGRLVLAGESLGLPSGTALAELWEGGRAEAEVETRTAWVQDLLSFDAMTLSAGLRWEIQDLGLREVDPADTLAPRLGLTHSFGPQRNTLLRASLSRFASRLSTDLSLAAHPEALRARAFRFQDLDGDLVLDPGEPSSFAFAISNRTLAPDLAPEITDEANLEMEVALLPEMLVALRGTWRRTSDVLEERWLVRDPATGEVFAATAADWVGLDLRPDLEWTGGRLLANGDRKQETLDLIASWNKRLSDRWMSRGHVAWHDWSWQTGPESTRFDDPAPALGGGDRDGDRLLLPVGGTVLPHEPARFLGSRWSFHAMGLVQLFDALNLSLAVDGHEGVPLTWYRQVLRERAGLVRIPVTGPGDRTANLVTADLLLSKEITWDDLGLTLSLDVFNLLDAGTIAEHELDLGTTRAGRPARMLAPRTFRVGARVSWR